MEAIVEGGEDGSPIEISSRCEKPTALPSQPRLGILE